MSKINPNRILFEDEHLLAVNKLARELAVKGKGPVQKLPLLDFLRKDYGPSLKPLHRLDFGTSGVVLFAKTKACFEQAITNGKFVGEHAKVTKKYRAIVMGIIPRKHGMINKRLPSRRRGDQVIAQTEYEVLRTFGDTSYVEASIHSGRMHQIRQHFLGIGHPLANDHLYGNEKFNRMFGKTFGFRHIFLHAYSVECVHFVTNEHLTVTAPLPDMFEKALKVLGH